MLPRVERVPVVLVPGVTGTILENTDTGKSVWGTGWRVLFPRGRGHLNAMSIVAPEDDPIDPAGAIERICLGFYCKAIYGPVGESFARHGWVVGNPEEPRADDTYFAFGYDFRQSNVESAAELRRFLEGLRDLRSEEVLEVDLLCQSNGAHICRYLLKYGGASLEAAESGEAKLPSTIRIRKIIFVGASNGGSMRIFAVLLRGRNYLGDVGRSIGPEILFTYRSLFEDLPAYREDRFLGPDGEIRDTDLFDPESWERFQWSVFDPEVAREIREADRPDLFGDREDRREYLAETLLRARRFRSLLDRDRPIPGTEVYIVEGAFVPTIDRAVMHRIPDGWRTLFGDEVETKNRFPALVPLTMAPGDTHATLESVHHLPPSERAAVAAKPHRIEGGHFEILIAPGTLEQIVRWLADG